MVRMFKKGNKPNLKSVYIQTRKLFDREVQRAKRAYWRTMQNDLLHECNTDNINFWNTIGKIGVGINKPKTIPMEIVLDDGSVSTNIDDILSKWKSDFSALFTGDGCTDFNCHQPSEKSDEIGGNLLFNQPISIVEVHRAVTSAHLGKACGVDNIPMVALKNDTSILFLHVLFNNCFSNGVIPSLWGKCIINPIYKSSSTDPREPLSYRGIALASAMYKIYCKILNERLYGTGFFPALPPG